MDWSMLTPHQCAHWDGSALHFTAGDPRRTATDGDALDDLRRTDYRSIFNPARLKVRAMQAEMPKKY
jgi:uracil-DNA glycosylase